MQLGNARRVYIDCYDAAKLPLTIYQMIVMGTVANI